MLNLLQNYKPTPISFFFRRWWILTDYAKTHQTPQEPHHAGADSSTFRNVTWQSASSLTCFLLGLRSFDGAMQWQTQFAKGCFSYRKISFLTTAKRAQAPVRKFVPFSWRHSADFVYWTKQAKGSIFAGILNTVNMIVLTILMLYFLLANVSFKFVTVNDKWQWSTFTSKNTLRLLFFIFLHLGARIACSREG